MKHVVEYKLHGGEIPYFIEDGGYFYNNGKLIGLTRDDVNCYIPPSTGLVTFASLNDFITHILTLSITGLDKNQLTNQQKTDYATAWWNARN